MKIRAVLGFGLFGLMLAPVAVMADPQQDQDACMMDAQTVCGQFIPDRERVAHCLMANRSRISPACRTAIAALQIMSCTAPSARSEEPFFAAAAPGSAAVPLIDAMHAPRLDGLCRSYKPAL